MNEVADIPERRELNVVATSTSALILDSGSMDSMMRLAEVMAKGRATIPEHLRGNQADCAAVVMQAIQWRMNPFAVAQKTHLVNGTLGYEAQLVNAVIQSSGVTQDRFAYEWYGPWEQIIGKTKVIKMPAKEGKKEYEFRVPDYGMADEVGLGVRVSATLKGEDKPRVLDLLLVQASVRNSPLWATDPKQQLAYLAVKRWTRLYAPDVILGVYSPDELEDINTRMVNMGNADVVPNDDVPPKPEYCSAEKFSANREAWKKVVTSGRKTAEQMIVFLETKAPLTDEQKREIKGWKKADAEAVTATPSTAPATKEATPGASDSDPFVAALDASGEYTPQ